MKNRLFSETVFIPYAERNQIRQLTGQPEQEGLIYRNIRGNNFHYFWKPGEEPRPYDTDELKRAIRENYKGLKPEQKELPEKMIREAGKTEEE